MKILLIKPSTPSAYDGAPLPQVPFPLGIMYLSAMLKRSGYDKVRLIHMDLGPVSMEELKKEVELFKPDVTGLSAIISEAKNMHEIASLVKQLLPDSLVVAGGPHATAYVEDCFENPSIDVVVKGEGDYSLPEIVKSFEKGTSFDDIQGISFRKEGKIVHTPDRPFIVNLDDLPFPDWGAVNIDVYKDFWPQTPMVYKYRYMSMFTSRGCPYQCTFCHTVMGRKFRAHSAKRILEEIRILYNDFGIRHFEIRDDIFNFDRQRTVDIFQGIISSGMDLNLYTNGVRGDLLDEELIDLFVKAKLFYMPVAIETASPRLQKAIKKNVDLVKLKKVIKYSSKKGIFVHGLFMLGFPGETMKEMLQTIWYAHTSRLHTAGFFVVHAHKRTELGDSLTDASKLVTSETATADYTTSPNFINCSDYSKQTIIRIRELANFIFYFNPVRIIRILRVVHNPHVLKIFYRKVLTRTFFPESYIKTPKQKTGDS